MVRTRMIPPAAIVAVFFIFLYLKKVMALFGVMRKPKPSYRSARFAVVPGGAVIADRVRAVNARDVDDKLHNAVLYGGGTVTVGKLRHAG